MKKLSRLRGGRFGPLLQTILICVMTYTALLAILFFGVLPEQVNIKVGMPAPTQIKATKDVQDTVTTEANRELAAAAVEASYKSVDPTVVDRVISNLTACFSALEQVQLDYTEAQIDAMTDAEIAALVQTLPVTLTREQLLALTRSDEETVNAVFADAKSALQAALVSTIPQGQESMTVRAISTSLMQSHFDHQGLVQIAVLAVEANIEPNMLIDEEITEENRQKARDEVQPIIYVKDQEIVSEGSIVTEAQYAMISALGILDEGDFDLKLLVGVAVLAAAALVSVGLYLRRFLPDLLKNVKQMALLSLIIVITMGLCLVLRSINSFFMPTLLSMLLVTLLIDGRLAVFVFLDVSLMTAMLAQSASVTYVVLLMTLSAPIVLLLFEKRMLRTTTLLAGLVTGVIGFALTLAVGFVNSVDVSDALNHALFAGGSCIISAAMCIGIQPLLEWLFNLATNSRLIELSNPNQPLLRQLLLEASGTYHHSIIVANLAEAACNAIGANGLLARVGSYYHDVGKLKRPMYFKENQMGDNPHDRTDPRVSAAILTAHPRDGAAMAQKARLPQPVIDIIRQHHGDSPVMYFYDKAQKQFDATDISSFRYEGPRPQTREAATVMLADTIEAATRAMPNPDPDKINALIRKLVRGKLNDGQLDQCPLTFSDIDRICSAFSTVLSGVFHERIEYPDVTIPPRGEAAPEAAPARQEPAQSAKPAPAPAAPKPAETPAKPAEAPQAAAEAGTVLTGHPAPPVAATAENGFVGKELANADHT